MFSAQNITLRFGARPIFENISFLINATDRIGLVGRNGAGKSTLLKALVGQYSLDEGQFNKPKECKISLLTQDFQKPSNLPVFEEAKSAFEEMLEQQKRMQNITTELETRDDYESDAYMALIDELTEIQTHIDINALDQVAVSIEKILFGLGFNREDFDKPMNSLSGGWQMRVELAKILLKKPNVLLLDEPTNHLDIESILWLEHFLKQYEGAVVLVSHDITFLDNVTEKIFEISLSRVEEYKGNYSKYLIQKEERKSLMQNAQKNQQDQIKQIERNIDRFRAKANKASFAQSLIKKLDKIERIELEDEDNAVMRFRFPKAPPSGKMVVTAKGIQKSFGEKQVIRGFDFEVLRGDKVAFVGKNGMGKSTMVKIIADAIKEYQGKLEFGHNVDMGYFAQEQSDELNGNKTVFQTIDDEALGDIRTQVRSLLGAFLFSNDEVEKKVKVLSGGERGRLALCKLMLHPYNFLVLDEPTNHLDIRAKAMLKDALAKFEGTFIIVSHDRDFLSGLTNKTFEFSEQGIQEYLGGIDEFMEKKSVASFRAFEQSFLLDKSSNTKANQFNKPIPSLEKDNTKQIKFLEQKISQTEEKILKLQEKLSLGNDTDLLNQYEKVQQQLQEYYESLEKLI
ncbi:MAG: ATP-binding cassette domain-containing protein [Chitinophagales bacterium]|jgi:ATP-binding cassette subfamily F protein 3|nr:ATP-binding cassette domain-containing protein [Chitinophagales bacterium]